MQISVVVNIEFVLYHGNKLTIILACLLSQHSPILSIFETFFKINNFSTVYCILIVCESLTWLWYFN